MFENQYVIWIIFGALFVLMIVMTIIPQRKQKKKMQEMMSSLSIGDKIMTIGGFIGTIVDINTENDRFTINVGTEEEPVKVVVLKNAIRNKI
ncbi:MAG: preprotein translocase subunit YajC [Clostridia bacterium]